MTEARCVWAWIVVLVLIAVVAAYTTVNFDEITRDVPLEERGNVPRFRPWTSAATAASLVALAAVVLGRLRVLRRPPLWFAVLASVPVAVFSLVVDFSLGALWT